MWTVVNRIAALVIATSSNASSNPLNAPPRPLQAPSNSRYEFLQSPTRTNSRLSLSQRQTVMHAHRKNQYSAAYLYESVASPPAHPAGSGRPPAVLIR